MKNWKHKEQWQKRDSNFLVEISRHEVEKSDMFPNDGIYRWCIYAYIYPTHPLFKNIHNEDIHQESVSKMPLHSGASLVRNHHDSDGEVTSIQVGADYNHLHDEQFTLIYEVEDASSIFDDAERLFEWLKNYKD